MSQFPRQYGGVGGVGSQELEYESRADSITVAQFFNTVYAWMCVGLALTACVGWYVSHSPLMRIFYANRGVYVLIALAAFGIAWYVQSQVARITATAATVLFLIYAAIVGGLISGIFIIYPAKTLVAAFVLTGGTFGVMSVYGFVTKRDLSRIGSIAVMLALGFIVASFVNLWIASRALDWIITYAILVLFIIITAWETQQLRMIATQLAHNPQMAARYAIVGSLVLYISFINLFLSILHILGGRRD